MRQQFLDGRLIKTLIDRRAILLEELGERVAERRGEAQLAVAHQRCDADAGDGLGQARDQRRFLRIGAGALGEHRSAVAAHHQDRGFRLACLDPLIEHHAIGIDGIGKPAGQLRASAIELGDACEHQQPECKNDSARDHFGMAPPARIAAPHLSHSLFTKPAR